MDTLNNMTSAASKAIWGNGESKEEPVSGVQGDTSKGEPYDAGNMGKLSRLHAFIGPGSLLTGLRSREGSRGRY